MSPARRLLVSSMVVVFAVACERGAPPPPPFARIDCPGLGVALTAVPPTLKVDVAEPGRLELVPNDATIEGRLSVELGEAQSGGVNLVDAVKAHQSEIVARPDGAYRGQREMGGPLGTMFYSRGRYSENGKAMEETTVYAVHPWGDRVLRIVYRYPAGEDSQARLEDHLFAFLEGVEPLAETPADGPATGAAAPPT